MTLPNFLIIGAAKAGTTSLHHYLGQHPDIYMTPVKEPAYYSRKRPHVAAPLIRTREAYEALFDGVTSEHAIGEASPQYLNDPGAPDRIAADLPHVRLIVSLRNPADRAYSSYLGRRIDGRERMRVDEAMQRGTYYFESSLYFPSLSRWFARFARERIHVVLFDEFTSDPTRVLEGLCAFLGVDTSFPFDVAIRHGAAFAPRSVTLSAAFWGAVGAVRRVLPRRLHNTGLAAPARRFLSRRPDPLPPAIRRRLLDDFAEDIRLTESLIGRPLSHWLA